ncbi:carbohydrate porin [Sphingomonas oligophenolica]|uniref:Carbohydrate porin n=1 Tax=Sphingomonas oligophenolica TaxID=301154 RepID=A0ABU9Y1I7_9SPHN
MSPRMRIVHHRRRSAVIGAAFCCVSALAGPGAQAQQAAMPQNVQHQEENGEMLKRRQAAITGALTYNSDANADLAGGADRGAAYLQRIGLIGDADLDRLIGWHGASAHVSVHFISGTGLSGSRVGNVLTVSGLEAEPAARLFNLWVEQKLGARATLRVGQFTAGQEFAISPTAGLFVNSTFGWPASFATDLPSGGPAYPLAAPGLRLAAMPGDGLTVRLAVFAGDPAGPGSGDPQRRDLHGFNGFRFAKRPFVIGEVSRSASGDDPAWALTLGGWMHTDSFDDLGLDDHGGSLAAPASTGIPLEHRGDLAVYAMADARLWKSGARALHGFMRASASPADRNPIDLYLDAGLSLAAPFRTRPGDTIGVGIAVARISPRLRSLLSERSAADGGPLDAPGFEGVVEATWQLKFGAHFYLQPNVQFVLHPAAALLDGIAASRPPPNAVVLGLRTSLRL